MTFVLGPITKSSGQILIESLVREKPLNHSDTFEAEEVVNWEWAAYFTQSIPLIGHHTTEPAFGWFETQNGRSNQSE